MTDERDVLEQLVRIMELTDQQEDAMLRGNHDVEETAAAVATVTESAKEQLGNGDCNWADIVEDANGGLRLDYDRAVLMDVQMVYHRGRGMFIKEMAFKCFTSAAVYNVNLAHDVADVPAHLLVKRGEDEQSRRYYHRDTGLELKSGDVTYDDQIIADTLNGANVVFLKGANKKSTLIEVFDRLEKKRGNDNKDGGAVVTRPTVVNVDAKTADDEDRLFCQTYGIALVAFSFAYVYKNFDAYLNAVLDSDSPSCNKEVVHINNVVAADARYNVSGRGRVICICHCDHSRGGVVKAFGTKQRCSLLNLSIMHYLWYGGRYEAFTASVRPSIDDTFNDRRNSRTSRAKRRRVRTSRNGRDCVPELRRPKTPFPSYAAYRDRWYSPVFDHHYRPYWINGDGGQPRYQRRRQQRHRRLQKQQQSSRPYNEDYENHSDAERRVRDDRYDGWYESLYRDDDEDGGYYYSYV